MVASETHTGRYLASSPREDRRPSKAPVAAPVEMVAEPVERELVFALD